MSHPALAPQHCGAGGPDPVPPSLCGSSARTIPPVEQDQSDAPQLCTTALLSQPRRAPPYLATASGWRRAPPFRGKPSDEREGILDSRGTADSGKTWAVPAPRVRPQTAWEETTQWTRCRTLTWRSWAAVSRDSIAPTI